jgi:hypothetical protein
VEVEKPTQVGTLNPIEDFMLLPTPKKFLLVGGVVAVVVLLTKRKQVGRVASRAAEKVATAVASSDTAFKLALPAAGRQYADDILRVAKEEKVSPFLVAAFIEQESGYGTGLSTGDHRGTGDKGHGHGLAQIDDRSFGAGSPTPWLTKKDANGTPLWQIPYENMKFGMQLLKQQLAFFAKPNKSGKVEVPAKAAVVRKGAGKAGVYKDPRPLSGNALMVAAIAAYNTGAGNVLWNLAVGQPAEFTTAKTKVGGSLIGYATNILNRVANLSTKAQQGVPA